MTTKPDTDAELRAEAKRARAECGRALRWLDPRYGEVDLERALTNARHALADVQSLIYGLEARAGLTPTDPIAP